MLNDSINAVKYELGMFWGGKKCPYKPSAGWAQYKQTDVIQANTKYRKSSKKNVISFVV